MLNERGSCVWQVRIEVEVEMPYWLSVDDNQESSRNCRLRRKGGGTNAVDG